MDVENNAGDAALSEFIEISVEDIRKDIQCPICLGIIRNTSVVMECLHRFCHDCIVRAVFVGKKCPTCRVKVASHRSLRRDPNFDLLISTIHEDLDKYEEMEVEEDSNVQRKNKIIQKQMAVIARRQSRAPSAPHRSLLAPLDGSFSDTSDGRDVKRQRKGVVPSDNDSSYDADEQAMEVDEPLTRKRTTSRPRRQSQNPDYVVCTSSFEEEDEGNNDDDDNSPPPRRIAATSALPGASLNAGKEPFPSMASPLPASATAPVGSLGSRAEALQNHLLQGRTLESNIETEVHFFVLPLCADGDERLPKLEGSYLCCPASLTVYHLKKMLLAYLFNHADVDIDILLPRRKCPLRETKFDLHQFQTAHSELYSSLYPVQYWSMETFLQCWEFRGTPMVFYRHSKSSVT